jgi:hypothetical protein
VTNELFHVSNTYLSILYVLYARNRFSVVDITNEKDLHIVKIIFIEYVTFFYFYPIHILFAAVRQCVLQVWSCVWR